MAYEAIADVAVLMSRLEADDFIVDKVPSECCCSLASVEGVPVGYRLTASDCMVVELVFDLSLSVSVVLANQMGSVPR